MWPAYVVIQKLIWLYFLLDYRNKIVVPKSFNLKWYLLTMTLFTLLIWSLKSIIDGSYLLWSFHVGASPLDACMLSFRWPTLQHHVLSKRPTFGVAPPLWLLHVLRWFSPCTAVTSRSHLDCRSGHLQHLVNERVGIWKGREWLLGASKCEWVAYNRRSVCSGEISESVGLLRTRYNWSLVFGRLGPRAGRTGRNVCQQLCTNSVSIPHKHLLIVYFAFQCQLSYFTC
jgi:hypothetical protein